MPETCRFCLQQISLVSCVSITQKMANSYFEITNKQLISSFELPSVSCSACANKLSSLSKDIKDLVKNEETLLKNLATARQNRSDAASISPIPVQKGFQCGGCSNYFNSKENLIVHRNQECRKPAPPKVAALKPLQPSATKPPQPAVPKNHQPTTVKPVPSQLQRTETTSALVHPDRLRRTAEFNLDQERLSLAKARAVRSKTFSNNSSESIPCDFPGCNYIASSVSLRVHKVLVHKLNYVGGKFTAGNKPACAAKIKLSKRSMSSYSYHANVDIEEEIPSSQPSPQRSSQRLIEKRNKRLKRE